MIHHEIDVREFEQTRQAWLTDDDGVAVNRIIATVENWNRKRHGLVRVNGSADDVSCLVTIKQATDDLELEIQMRTPRSSESMLDQRLGYIAYVTLDVFERQIKPAIE